MPRAGTGAGGQGRRARRHRGRPRRAGRARRLDRAGLRRRVGGGRTGGADGRGRRGHLRRPGVRGEGDGGADRGMPGRPRPRHSGVPGQRRGADAVRRIPGCGAMTGMRPAGGPRQPPPEGYLGAAARITSGPAPELVAAGYELEIADAPLLHRGLTLADLAHLAELVECGTLSRDEAAPVCAALLGLLDSPAAEFPYDPVYGDAYNSRERELERALGPAAGWLHLGRTRREAGRIAFRLALRDKLLSLHADVIAFASVAGRLEAEHAATMWAESTYLQPAQPSTFGHYLG